MWFLKSLGLITLVSYSSLCLGNEVISNAFNSVNDPYKHLHVLASEEAAGRKPQSAGHAFAQKYIYDQFLLNNNLVASKQYFDYEKGFKTKKGVNVITTKYGKSDKTIVITAHYDHLGTKSGKIYYGADDNASGVSVLITVSNWLNTIDTHYSYVLVATDAEEQGLHGAHHYLKQNVHKRLVLNINLDMLGYGVRRRNLIWYSKNKDTFQNLITNKVNKQVTIPLVFKSKVVDSSISSVKSRISLSRASDHYEFFKQGIPFILITGENHRFYHTNKDTVDNIDENFIANAYLTVKNMISVIDSENKL